MVKKPQAVVLGSKASGDDYVLGASSGYQLNKNISLDLSYAHAFTQNRPIEIITQRKYILGINKGCRDSVSLKLTVQI